MRCKWCSKLIERDSADDWSAVGVAFGDGKYSCHSAPEVGRMHEPAQNIDEIRADLLEMERELTSVTCQACGTNLPDGYGAHWH